MSTLSSYKDFHMFHPPQETEKSISSERKEAREVCTEKKPRRQCGKSSKKECEKKIQ